MGHPAYIVVYTSVGYMFATAGITSPVTAHSPSRYSALNRHGPSEAANSNMASSSFALSTVNAENVPCSLALRTSTSNESRLSLLMFSNWVRVSSSMSQPANVVMSESFCVLHVTMRPVSPVVSHQAFALSDKPVSCHPAETAMPSEANMCDMPLMLTMPVARLPSEVA